VHQKTHADETEVMVASIKGQLAEPQSDLIPSTSALSSALLLDIGFATLNKYYAINTNCLDVRQKPWLLQSRAS
jgi:hypothetical protein